MSDRSKGSSGTSGILHLLSFGFVGAATVTVFSVAVVSLLGIGKVPLASSGGASVFRDADLNVAPIPVQTYWPTLASATLPLASPAQAQSTPEPPEVSDPKPAHERPSLDDNASTVTSETARELGGPPPITHTRSTEVNRSEPSVTERRPICDQVSGAPDLLQQTEQDEGPDDPRGHVLRTIEIQRNQSAKLEQDDFASDQKAPPQNAQRQRADLHLLSPSAAFRSRVRKECGSIIFRTLYRHCVASFGAHYR
jgi:hypothetical protein